eukprot:scaffold178797_cov18-Tisochrysis_lutea.AAC.2
MPHAVPKYFNIAPCRSLTAGHSLCAFVPNTMLPGHPPHLHDFLCSAPCLSFLCCAYGFQLCMSLKDFMDFILCWISHGFHGLQLWWSLMEINLAGHSVTLHATPPGHPPHLQHAICGGGRSCSHPLGRARGCEGAAASRRGHGQRCGAGREDADKVRGWRAKA